MFNHYCSCCGTFSACVWTGKAYVCRSCENKRAAIEASFDRDIDDEEREAFESDYAGKSVT